MTDLTIITNNKPRELVPLHSLPAKAQLDFDYIREAGDGNSYRLFQYKGVWYDLNEFVRIVERSKMQGFEHGVDAGSPLLKWGAIQTDSFFSGVVVRWAAPMKGDIIVGTVMS